MKHHLENSDLCAPREAYDALVQGKFLHADAVQAGAVDELQALHGHIIKRQNRSWLKRVTGGKDAKGAPRGVYMHGGVGRGKSMLMDLFYDCLPEDVSKRRVHFHGFMIEVHNYMHERRGALKQSGAVKGVDVFIPELAKRIARESRVLCFDEFHVVDVADAMILGRLFTALFEHGVVVVATSNWEPDRLYEGGLQRDRFEPFIELLKARMSVFHLDSETDYRRKTLAKAGMYFTPISSAVDAEMDALFAALTDEAPPRSETLEVKGRKIEVAAVARNVARFSFAQLCEQPLGAEDYIKIASRYSTVFLDHIPKMGYDRRNEVKRLMNLIDALYEARRTVVISAAVPPDQLYSGHDHSFEFDRTISRLIEMQSEEYLADKD